MLVQSKNNGSIPSPDKLQAFCEFSIYAANCAADEKEWYEAISKRADNWLSSASREQICFSEYEAEMAAEEDKVKDL